MHGNAPARSGGVERSVVLVDQSDRELGKMEVGAAHAGEGHLHRAVSVLVFNREGKLLLQERAAAKRTEPLKWSNTACTHPRPGESLSDAAARSISVELGIHCPLSEVMSFTYSVACGEGMSEREFDHVFVGTTDETPVPNPEEVRAVKWSSLEELYAEVRPDSTNFSPWFRILLVELAARRLPLPPRGGN